MASHHLLIGRAAELRALDGVLGIAAAGEAAAVAVVGEPGIGKTRLVVEARRHAEKKGLRTFVGRGVELEESVAFGLIVDALDAAFALLDPEVLRPLGSERLAELAAVLPSLSGRGDARRAPLDVERFRAHRALHAALSLVAERGGALLLVDDAQWGDPASIEVLRFLLRHPIPGLALVVTYREHQAPATLSSIVERSVQAGEATLLPLAPLGRDDAAALLDVKPDSSPFLELYRESEGNPFYLEQLARAPRTSVPSPTPDVLGSDQRLPAPVRAAIAQELRALPPDARRLLEAAAVLGEPFDPAHAARLVALATIEERRALARLVDAELVRPDATPQRLVFRHPVVRRAVYDGCDLSTRRALHARAAVLAEALGAPLSSRAHHIEHSAALGDEEAIALLTEAGEAASALAPAAAAHWFTAAARLLRDERDPRYLGLFARLAGALAVTGRLHEAREVLSDVMRALPADARAERLGLTTTIARIEQGLGNGRAARRLLAEALGQMRPGSPEAIALRLELAKNHVMLGEWRRAAETAERARGEALRDGDRVLLLAAAATGAFVAQFLGGRRDVERAQELIALAGQLVDALSDGELTPSALEALATLCYAETSFEHFEVAGLHARRGLRLARETGQGSLLVDFYFAIAASSHLLGRVSEARAAAETASEAALLLENDQLIAVIEGTRAWIAALQGDVGDSLRAGENAVSAAARAPHSLFAWHACVCYADALLQAGQLEAGRAQLLMAGGPTLSEVPPSSRPHWMARLAWVELELGNAEAAARMAEHAEAVAAPLGLAMRGADALLARACAHLAAEDGGRAVKAALAASDEYSAVRAPVEAARAQLVAARGFVQTGERGEAQRLLASARGVLEACGARDLAARAVKLLGVVSGPAAGERGGEPRFAGLAKLTPREHDIALCLLEGFSNRQIAQKFFLSEKTIEAYMTRLFVKLGVNSRAAAAVALERAR